MEIPEIKRISAADEVFKTLHGWIMSEKLKDGDKLPSQDDLAKQFGVSRNTLREAIYKLTVMGLLTPKQGVGTVVNIANPSSYLSALSDHLLLNPGSLREFLEARVFVERTIVSLAAVRVREKDLSAMENLLGLQVEAFQSDQVEAFIRYDSEFHMTLAKASDNYVLVKFLQSIQELLQKFISEVSCLPGAVDSAIRFHREILDGLIRRDRAKVEEKINAHLHDVARRIERCMNLDLGIDVIFENENMKKSGKFEITD